MNKKKILIYGGKGWIGNQIVELLNKYTNTETIVSETRVKDYNEILDELKEILPSHVICCIGKTSGIVDDKYIKTIDYLEQPGKLVENIGNNLYGPLILAKATNLLNIHMTYMGTGCIFQYLESEKDYKFTENDLPNFFGSSYSIVKGYTDTMMKDYNNVLNVRIRMPISYKENPREFITKITSYSNICSIPNSMTVLDDLLPIMIDMAFQEKTGTINLVNPDVISHNEILEMYKEIIDNKHTWKNVTYDEQMKLIVSHRSNNHLNTDKLEKMYPNVKDIKSSIKQVLLNRKTEN